MRRRRHRSTLGTESGAGVSLRGPVASTDTSWLPFDENKPMVKAGWGQENGSQQPVQRALQVLCW